MDGKAKETIADAVFDRLAEAIIGGRLAPGEKISEPRLAREFGISRGPLREAIRRLQERRLVTHHPRQGVRVVIPSQELLAELFMIREALEGIAAREAALRMTEPEMDEMLRMLASHGEMLQTDSPDAYIQSSDSDFHFFIVRASGNTLLSNLICGEYNALLRFYRIQHRTVQGRAKRAFEEHCRIADAICERDSELAEFLMRRHVAAAQKARVPARTMPAPI